MFVRFELWVIPLVLVSSFLNSYGSYLLKKSSCDATKKILKLFLNPKFILAGFTLVMGAILFVIALRGGPLNILYPLSSTSYLWTCYFATKYLKESMNLNKWLGVLTIIFGIIIITVS